MARTSRSARALTDHQEIQDWAEQRGARPTCVRGTGGGDDVGMIRLDFPGYSGQDSLQPIEWDEWFQKFDENNLALLVQGQTARGQKSNFNKLVSRDSAEERNEMQDDGNNREEGRSSTRRSARGRASTRTTRSGGSRRRSASARASRSARGRSGKSRSGRSQGRSSRTTTRKSTANARGVRRSSSSARKRSGSVRENSRRRAA